MEQLIELAVLPENRDLLEGILELLHKKTEGALSDGALLEAYANKLISIENIDSHLSDVGKLSINFPLLMSVAGLIQILVYLKQNFLINTLFVDECIEELR